MGWGRWGAPLQLSALAFTLRPHFSCPNFPHTFTQVAVHACGWLLYAYVIRTLLAHTWLTDILPVFPDLRSVVSTLRYTRQHAHRAPGFAWQYVRSAPRLVRQYMLGEAAGSRGSDRSFPAGACTLPTLVLHCPTLV